MDMQIPSHKSSNIHSVGFSEPEGRGRLRVQFKDKEGQPAGLGEYVDVPRSIFNALLTADSPGKFVRAHLIPHFKYEKVQTEEQPKPDLPGGCGCQGGLD